MKINEMMERWRRVKRRFGCKRLDAPCSIEHEYKDGPTSAFVRFDCAPADELSVVVGASWPTGITVERSRMDDAVAAAVLDVLSANEAAGLRCAVTLVEIKWTGTAPSDVAFYRATARAMTTLRDAHPWSAVAGR
jgi:hypothetical protein